MNTSPTAPRVDAADLLASLSAQARKAVEQSGTEDVEALACEALARDTPGGMKTGPSGRVSDSDLAEAFLDHARPLVSTVSLARLMPVSVGHSRRTPTGVSLPAELSREVGEVYVIHRVSADMGACPAVRRRLLEGPRRDSLYNALMITSRNVDLARWEMRCVTVSRPPARGLPPRPRWFGRALALVPALHYSIPSEAVQLGVDLLLELDRRRYRQLSAVKRARLRSLLIDIALQWEKVKSHLDETCHHFYTGRYTFGLESEAQLGASLKVMGALHRKAEKAAGAVGFRRFTEGFDSAVAPAGARIHAMTVAYDWIAVFY